MATWPSGTEKRYRRMRLQVGELEVAGQEFMPRRSQGNSYYVSSTLGVSTNHGRTPEAPITTLDAAFALCAGDQGDVIYVMPNHSETITGAAGIAHDVAGVAVVGLGTGNQRPRFLMDAGTSVTYAITAADAYLENLVFAAGHADIVACITTTKAYTTIVDCEFVENVATENFLSEIKATSTTDNDSDGLTVIGCRAISVDGAALEFIEINADVANAVISDNTVSKKGSAVGYLVLCATGKDLQDYVITGNRVTGAAAALDILVSNDTGAANWGITNRNEFGRIGNPNNSQFVDGLGYRVTKAATLASDPDDLFVATGKNLITLMIGEVTSVFATTSSMSINSSTGQQVMAASTDVTTSVVGTLYILTGDPDDGLNGSASGANRGADIATGTTGFHRPILINDDNIYMNLNGAGTGLIQWDLYYIPMENGAYITSAA